MTIKSADGGMAAAGLGLALAVLAQGAHAESTADALHRRVPTLDSHVDVQLGGGADQAALTRLRSGGVAVSASDRLFP